nr:MAG: hypothetical protein J07AB56_04440 [Candidatus Nanosalinarum sp. J07AB56]
MEDGVVMIDGSLLTRLRVMPSELDVSDGKSRNMRLINRFQDLLDLVEERNLDLIGVSKDSETQVFGRKLIENYIEERTDAEFKQIEIPGKGRRRVRPRKQSLGARGHA